MNEVASHFEFCLFAFTSGTPIAYFPLQPHRSIKSRLLNQEA